jgi:hypothetical protein
MRLVRLFLLVTLLAFAPFAVSKGSAGHSSGQAASRGPARSSKCSGCSRNSKGKIVRNRDAVRRFIETNPCPGRREDYVVDHIVPLKRGGTDDPSNMQWQTKADAKAKDKVE